VTAWKVKETSTTNAKGKSLNYQMAIPDGHSQGTQFQAVTHKTRGRKSGTGRDVASVKVRIEPLKV